jgi:hypothetical protein
LRNIFPPCEFTQILLFDLLQHGLWVTLHEVLMWVLIEKPNSYLLNNELRKNDLR